MKKRVSLLWALLGFASLQILGQDLSSLYETLLPSVVKILTAEQSSFSEPGYIVTEKGIGSGVLIDESGLILTASHVVNTATRINVQFADGETIPADVMYSVPAADVALIKLVWPSKDRPVARLGDSDKVKVGHQIFMVGAPYGLDFSLSVGHISGRQTIKKFTSGSKWIEFLQTDASINQGNSGGPMFNMDGEVIGIASYILTESGGSQGLGFAATSNICQLLLLQGQTPWTGVESIVISGELCRLLNVPQHAALLIEKVSPLSPADILGLKGGSYPLKLGTEETTLGGDIVLAVNGIKILGDESLEKVIQSIQNNETIELVVLRAGEVIQLSGTLKN